MIGTTDKWWRGFLYLGIAVALLDDLTVHVSPIVSEVNDAFGMHLAPDYVAKFVVIPIFMGIALYCDWLIVRAFAAVVIAIIAAVLSGHCNDPTVAKGILSCCMSVEQKVAAWLMPIVDHWPEIRGRILEHLHETEKHPNPNEITPAVNTPFWLRIFLWVGIPLLIVSLPGISRWLIGRCFERKAPTDHQMLVPNGQHGEREPEF
jgi:hypothetical protein